MLALLTPILIGGVLWQATPDAMVDLQTGRPMPTFRSGPDTFVLRPPDMRPTYVVPLPESGAGSSLYIDPFDGGPD